MAEMLTFGVLRSQILAMKILIGIFTIFTIFILFIRSFGKKYNYENLCLILLYYLRNNIKTFKLE